MIKVMIADDQELMRESLNILLSSKEDIKIVGLLKDGDEVVDNVEAMMPDVILMDIRMPKMNGVLCTKAIKAKYPNIKVIILTTFDDDEYIFDALKYGAEGYLLKGISLNELYDAIVKVNKGEAILHDSVMSKTVKMFSKMAKNTMIKDDTDEEIVDLSKNEKMIILKVKDGLSNKEIAKELCFSEGTIRNYISVILDKLYLRDRTQLAVWATSHEAALIGNK